MSWRAGHTGPANRKFCTSKNVCREFLFHPPLDGNWSGMIAGHFSALGFWLQLASKRSTHKCTRVIQHDPLLGASKLSFDRENLLSSTASACSSFYLFIFSLLKLPPASLFTLRTFHPVYVYVAKSASSIGMLYFTNAHTTCFKFLTHSLEANCWTQFGISYYYNVMSMYKKPIYITYSIFHIS